MEESNNNGKVIGIIITVVLVALAFVGGYFLGTKTCKKNDCNCDVADKKSDEPSGDKDPKRDIDLNYVPLTDKFVLGTYDVTGLYLLDDGEVYYLEAEYIGGCYQFLTHSAYIYDSSISNYLGNEYYGNKPVKVEGLDNVKRLKLFNGYKSGGENFQVFAITYDGVVYEINKGKLGSRLLENVENMIGDKDNNMIAIFKDGSSKKISYSYEAWAE